MVLATCLLAAGVVLGACDRNSDSAGGEEALLADSSMEDRPSLEQVCGLLEPAEVEAVLGRKVGKPRELAGSRPIAVGMRHCVYGDPVQGQVTLGLASAFAPQVFKKAVGQLERDLSAIVPVQNLGDEAVMFFGGYLLVREGRHVLYVAVRRSGSGFSSTEAAPAAVREENIALALDLLKRLPRTRSSS